MEFVVDPGAFDGTYLLVMLCLISAAALLGWVLFNE